MKNIIRLKIGTYIFVVISGLLLLPLAIAAASGSFQGNSLPAAKAGAGELATPDLITTALEKGEIDSEKAALYLAYALTGDNRLPAAYRSDVPWSGTLPLQQLKQQLETIEDGREKVEAEIILRGICGGWDGLGGPSVPEHDILDTEHFHFQYAAIGSNLTIENYAQAFEAAWTTQVDAFGWAAPPVFPPDPPPGNRYHVRVEDLTSGLVGFVATDGVHAGLVGNNPNTPWNEGDAYATCMVFTTAMPGEVPLWALQAGAAREINYAIQFGYGTLTGGNTAEPAFARGAAVWMEDEVFDPINLNYGQLWPSFNSCMGQYTAASDRYWITWRGLTERYTTGVGGGAEQVMEDFFESLSQNSAGGLLPAMNSALVNKGTTLPDAYHAYAVAAKFSKNCGGGYGYPYCFREGASYVAAAGIPAVHGSVAAVGGSHAGTVPDNYALNWVNLPLSGGPYDITLDNNSGGQFRGSVVCDTGATLIVTPFPQVVGAGDSTLLANYNPAGCTSLVAVLTNQAQTAANPSSCSQQGYQITVSEPAPNMAGSGMDVSPRIAAVGEVVTYTARLINSGTQFATVVFSNTLPPDLQLVGTPTASSGSPPIVSGQTITWSGIVQNGESVLITFSAEVMTTTVIINTAQLDDGQGNIYTFLAIVNGQYSYFPVIRQN